MFARFRTKPLTAEVEEKLKAAILKHALKIERRAKKELYPGHGKVSGTLQRSIQAGDNVERVGNRLRVYVRTKGVPYARRIHRLYQYLTKGVEKAGKLKV